MQNTFSKTFCLNKFIFLFCVFQKKPKMKRGGIDKKDLIPKKKKKIEFEAEEEEPQEEPVVQEESDSETEEEKDSSSTEDDSETETETEEEVAEKIVQQTEKKTKRRASADDFLNFDPFSVKAELSDGRTITVRFIPALGNVRRSSRGKAAAGESQEMDDQDQEDAVNEVDDEETILRKSEAARKRRLYIMKQEEEEKVWRNLNYLISNILLLFREQ
jgi:hypothetical protein